MTVRSTRMEFPAIAEGAIDVAAINAVVSNAGLITLTRKIFEPNISLRNTCMGCPFYPMRLNVCGEVAPSPHFLFQIGQDVRTATTAVADMQKCFCFNALKAQKAVMTFVIRLGHNSTF